VVDHLCFVRSSHEFFDSPTARLTARLARTGDSSSELVWSQRYSPALAALALARVIAQRSRLRRISWRLPPCRLAVVAPVLATVMVLSTWSLSVVWSSFFALCNSSIPLVDGNVSLPAARATPGWPPERPLLVVGRESVWLDRRRIAHASDLGSLEGRALVRAEVEADRDLASSADCDWFDGKSTCMRLAFDRAASPAGIISAITPAAAGQSRTLHLLHEPAPPIQVPWPVDPTSIAGWQATSRVRVGPPSFHPIVVVDAADSVSVRAPRGRWTIVWPTGPSLASHLRGLIDETPDCEDAAHPPDVAIVIDELTSAQRLLDLVGAVAEVTLSPPWIVVQESAEDLAPVSRDRGCGR
jgi:hypothetical protein